MYKVEYKNSVGQIVSETMENQTKLVKFLSTLDSLDCEIINVYQRGAKGYTVL